MLTTLLCVLVNIGIGPSFTLHTLLVLNFVVKFGHADIGLCFKLYILLVFMHVVTFRSYNLVLMLL